MYLLQIPNERQEKNILAESENGIGKDVRMALIQLSVAIITA